MVGVLVTAVTESLTDKVIVACIAGLFTLLGAVLTFLGQRWLESRKARREETRKNAVGLNRAKATAREIRDKLINARATLEATRDNWPPGERFALKMNSEDYAVLGPYLDLAAWAAMSEVQSDLESVLLRRELWVEDQESFRPDGERSMELRTRVGRSLTTAERALQQFIGDLDEKPDDA